MQDVFIMHDLCLLKLVMYRLAYYLPASQFVLSGLVAMLEQQQQPTNAYNLLSQSFTTYELARYICVYQRL